MSMIENLFREIDDWEEHYRDVCKNHEDVRNSLRSKHAASFWFKWFFIPWERTREYKTVIKEHLQIEDELYERLTWAYALCGQLVKERGIDAFSAPQNPIIDSIVKRLESGK